MATRKSISKPAVKAPQKPVGLPPSKPHPPLTLISKATETWPLADTDVRKHFGFISDRLREVVKYGESLYHLTELEEGNPVIAGATFFLNILMERVSDAADNIDTVTAMLHTEGEK